MALVLYVEPPYRGGVAPLHSEDTSVLQLLVTRTHSSRVFMSKSLPRNDWGPGAKPR